MLTQAASADAVHDVSSYASRSLCKSPQTAYIYSARNHEPIMV